MHYQSLGTAILSTAAVYLAAAEPVVIGKYPAKIVPEQISDIRLPENGIITDLAPEGTRLSKGDTIAIINKEQTARDREDMELDLARERIAKKDEIRKLEAQRRQVTFYLSLSEGERRYNTDFQGKDQQPTADSLKDIDERMELLQRELTTLERRKKREFDLKHDKLTISMPFDGQLQYNVPLPESAEERANGFTLPENNMRTFATVCDDSAYYITIPMADGANSLLDEQLFCVEISLPAGKKLVGRFAQRKVEHAGNGDALIYYFRIAAEEHDKAFRMLGSRYTATLLYEADGGVLRVSKAKLAAHPQAARCENWEQLVQLAHPGYAILIIGAADIVLCRTPAAE